MLTLRRRGCLALWPPLRQMANPQRGKTTNRRAGCGKTACPVRREGGPNPISSPYPYNSRRRYAGKKQLILSHVLRDDGGKAGGIELGIISQVLRGGNCGRWVLDGCSDRVGLKIVRNVLQRRRNAGKL